MDKLSVSAVAFLTIASALPCALIEKGLRGEKMLIDLGRSPLGTNCENAVTLKVGRALESVSAKPLLFVQKNNEEERRTEKYVLQSIAKLALPDERVASCHRKRFMASEITVIKHRATEKCFYGGLVTCGSVWMCPVCASKISERRRTELKKAFDSHLENGGLVAMLTLTFSHKREDKLGDTLKRFSKASERFRSGKRYQQVKEEIGLIGTIRSFEITYGSNGFHPHTHIVLFYTNPVNLRRIRNTLYDLWLKACIANDLYADDRHGLTLKDASFASEYCAKWGLEREITKANSKKGKKDNLTPFDFLRKFQETEDSFYLKLFRDYGLSMKGKNALMWSPGLKKAFQIGEKSDEEIATERIEEADQLGCIEYETWKLIAKKELRGKLLSLIEKHGFQSGMEILYEDYLEEETNKKTLAANESPTEINY